MQSGLAERSAQGQGRQAERQRGLDMEHDLEGEPHASCAHLPKKDEEYMQIKAHLVRKTCDRNGVCARGS